MRLRDDPAFIGSVGTMAVIVVAELLVPLRGVLPAADLLLVVLLPIVAAGALGGSGAGAVVGGAGALAFDFFHTEPYLRLSMSSKAEPLTAALMVAAGFGAGVGISRRRRARGRAEGLASLPTSTLLRENGQAMTTVARRKARPGGLPARRRAAGYAVALVGAPLLTAVLTHLRDDVHQPSVLLLFVLVVVAAAAVGGAGPGLAAAVGGFALVNWFFTPPLRTLAIAGDENVVALTVFLLVAATVSWFVATVARRSTEAAQAREEAATLARAAAGTVAEDPVPVLLEHLRNAFGLDGASILHEADGAWSIEAAVGPEAPTAPHRALAALPLGEHRLLALSDDPPDPDRGVLQAFASQLAAALESRRLRAEASEAARLAEVNELRTALLTAVSHDLRTPLASIKAAVTSLLAEDIEWEPAVAREFYRSINEETDRLNSLVGNLLDMSRITTGAVDVLLRPVGIDEIVPAALASLGRGLDRSVVDVEVPETLPRVLTDPALLERAIANLVDNAVAWSPAGSPVRLEAVDRGDAIELRVIDHGPGVPAADRERIFLPFQRRGDSSSGGVGLGLAVARGFVEVLHGTLAIDDTVGGGLTMVVTVPVAPAPDAAVR